MKHQSCLLLASLVASRSFAFAPQSPGLGAMTPASMMTNTQQEAAQENPLLEDRKGHINPELAQRIYKWEQQQRMNLNLPTLDYSTREGLRIVLDLVTKIASSNANAINEDRYEDLIQEGIIALMQAMTHYEDQARPQQSFEAFAKDSIQRALEDYSWGVKTATTGGTQSKPALSMESTLEINDPLETHYSNQEEWEVREGLKEPKQDFVDTNLQYEGEDQMWVHQQQVAAPLRDMIPDGHKEEHLLDGGGPISPDDLALTDMIRYNVDEFLGSTLGDVESQIIQMRFGLDQVDRIPKTQKEVAFELDLSVSKVRKIQRLALDKLRASYANRYRSDDEDDHHWQDSV
jgi:RNA polymerase sigma factor (sigma-70 family)